MDEWILKVKGIRPEAKDTITILLERVDGGLLEYRAGQFLTLLLRNGAPGNNTGLGGFGAGRELRRSYSFSSTPGVDAMAAITVKRAINGEVSRYLLDHLRVGDELVSLPPAGRFVLDGVQWLFFIAAGSGMAPVFSLLKEALVKMPDSRVVLISQNHNEESILFKRALEELVQNYGERFRWVNLLSTWEGRLNNWWMEELMGQQLLRVPEGEQSDVLFYLCGPPAFMRMAQFTLRVMGFGDEQIRQEHFTVEYVPPPPLLTDTTPKKVMIHAGSRKYQFEVAWPVTILQAALNQGIPLPYSCRGGRCSTCVAKCVNGKVKMSINEVLTEKDLRDGLVLTCVGYAETDVELAF
ncbi:MAG TPA: iron-sulfur cluster-binding domain-containing protein [Puia sp.]|nr:iron-sulfur cluster-binding domain-containing protein [Puia sp.]